MHTNPGRTPSSNPVHVVATGDQKAAHRQALRHVHADLAAAEQNLRHILRGTVSWRARFPPAPRLAITDESSAVPIPSPPSATPNQAVPSTFVPPWTDAAESESPG